MTRTSNNSKTIRGSRKAQGLSLTPSGGQNKQNEEENEQRRKSLIGCNRGPANRHPVFFALSSRALTVP